MSVIEDLEEDFMDRLYVVLWSLFAIPCRSLILTGVAWKLWWWFLSLQYGPGPSFGAWFGAAATIHILTWHPTVKNIRDSSDVRPRDLIRTSVTSWSAILMILAVVYVVGSMFGWVR